jgi:DNA-binding response OmpR family regulator
MHILVIDDDLRLTRQITRELERYNHEASAHNDGADGLEAALLNPPDLVILDINLPGLDGFSVLARLRKAHSTARILILTARGEVEDRIKGLKGGADDYLGKPFSMNELMARIEALGLVGHVQRLGYVDDPSLQWLYENCTAWKNSWASVTSRF